MKKSTGALLIILLLVAVGGAGYQGVQRARGESLPTVEPPSTVTVTRGEVRQTVTAPGRLVSTLQVVLEPEDCGRLSMVDVRPGDEVQKGDTLARLATARLEEQLSSAQAELEVAQVRLMQIEAGPSEAELAAARYSLLSAEALLNQLRAGPPETEIAAAQSEVAAAQKELDHLNSLPSPVALARAQAEFDLAKVNLQHAQAAYDQVKDRPEVGMLPQGLALQKATIAFDAANAAFEAASQPATPAEVEAAQARLVSARSKLSQIQAGPPPDELSLAELSVLKAEAELAQLTAGPSAADLRQAQLAVLTAQSAVQRAQSDLLAANLTAPFHGVVLEVGAGPGEVVCPGERFMVLMDPSALEVESTVIEEDLPLVQAGRRAELFFDAQPDALVAAQVSRIVPQRSPASDRPLYPVYFAADYLPEGLAPGMTVDASIIIAHERDVLRLPRTVARARRDGTAQIRVWAGGQIETRTVKVGLRGDVYIQILEGLHEGEEVLGQ